MMILRELSSKLCLQEPMSMGTRIRERRESLGLSQAALARRFGLTREAVSAWEHDKNLPDRERWPSLAENLQCSVRWLETGEDEEPASPEADAVVKADSGVVVPFAKIACIGRQFEKFKFFDDQLLQQLRAGPDDLRCYEIEGPSMEPLFRAGDVVLIDIRRTSYAEPGLFVIDNGIGVVCKWVERKHDSDADYPMLRLKSENCRFAPYDVPAVKITICGRVVWSSRRW
jgi:transcriptional regulator with XRE-family HTH domain